MGEVYRARDTKLNRDVAVKVLLPAVANDPDRLARFSREAQVLASLNHPNIAAIYGIEESNDITALVMELVEGEDLSQRIARGAMPIDEALPIARQIAEALEAAHDHGIIHRDLKPANIKMRADGTVKVLDFGLAKAIDPIGGASATAMNSPTLSIHATEAGIILGTAAYMSPEQAAGKSVDRRSDLWAFGAVLFEMLTGRRAFAGETLSHVIAAVLKDDPDWRALPLETPPSVHRLLRRCLEKDRKRRLADAADGRLELDDVSEPRVVAAGSRWSRVVPWSLAVLLGAALIAIPATRRSTTAAREVLHFDLPNPPGVEVQAAYTQTFSLSQDGTRVAFIGIRDDGVRMVFVRGVSQPDLVQVPGSSGANAVAFSPDGTAVVFISATAGLVTFRLDGSETRTLAPSADATAMIAWGTPGIAFLQENELWFVDPAVGVPRRLTKLDPARKEVIHAIPAWLDNRVLVFANLTSEAGTERIEAVTLDAEPQRTVIMERARKACWSSARGLLFDRDGALHAVPFDLATLKTTGRPETVLAAGIAAIDGQGALAVQATFDGTLAYTPAGYGNSLVVIVDRNGSSKPLDIAPGRFTNPRFSPDGRRLALDDDLSSEAIIDLERGTKIAVLQHAPGSGFVSWNGDGTRLAFRRYGVPYSTAADGIGGGSPIKYATAADYVSAEGPNPDEMLMVRITPDTSGDIYLFSLSGAHPPKPLITTRGYQGGPKLSPDGRWLVYQSDETGRAEIYVRAYPALDRAWQVSVGGGAIQPRWGAGGGEVLYRSGRAVVAVPFEGRGVEPALGKPQMLFTERFDFGRGISIANYDVSRDGRLVMLRAQQATAPIHVIRNWAAGLEK
jgi:Tol biopolymer transport system component